MKKIFFALLGSVFFFVGTERGAAQSLELKELSNYYVKLAPEANFATVEKLHPGMAAAARSYIKNGYSDNNRYYTIVPSSGGFRTAVRMYPARGINQKFIWKGKKYGLLDPDNRKHHFMVDSENGFTALVGCFNTKLEEIQVRISDYVSVYENKTVARVQNPKKQDPKSRLKRYDTTKKTSCGDCGKTQRQRISLRDEGYCCSNNKERKTVDRRYQPSLYVDAQRANQYDLPHRNPQDFFSSPKKRWKPFWSFKTIEMSPVLSVLSDIAIIGGAIYGISRLSSKGSSGSDFRPPNDGDYHPATIVPSRGIRFRL